VEFSYSLFLVLLLLFPGLCFWVGMRIGDRTDLASPAPERPNSTGTLFLIVLGTIIGHVVGSTYFVLQEVWCNASELCFPVSYDPNIYKALLQGGHAPEGISDFAVETWLVGILLVGFVASIIGHALVRWQKVTDVTDTLSFGWLNAAVKAVKAGDAFIVAYVLTKTTHEGMSEGLSVAYEGEVQHLALDEDQSIKHVVLNEVDRFLVSVSNQGLSRIDVRGSVIEQLHITSDQIANVAFEIFRAPKSAVDEVNAEEGRRIEATPHPIPDQSKSEAD